MNARPKRYRVEGMDENGQWSWSNVSADGIESHTMFDLRADAEAARLELVRIYGCPDMDVRVVEIPMEAR